MTSSTRRHLLQGLLSPHPDDASLLCRRGRISRPVPPKWLRRFGAATEPGLCDRTRRPVQPPSGIELSEGDAGCVVRAPSGSWGYDGFRMNNVVITISGSRTTRLTAPWSASRSPIGIPDVAGNAPSEYPNNSRGPRPARHLQEHSGMLPVHRRRRLSARSDTEKLSLDER